MHIKQLLSNLNFMSVDNILHFACHEKGQSFRPSVSPSVRPSVTPSGIELSGQTCPSFSLTWLDQIRTLSAVYARVLTLFSSSTPAELLTLWIAIPCTSASSEHARLSRKQLQFILSFCFPLNYRVSRYRVSAGRAHPCVRIFICFFLLRFLMILPPWHSVRQQQAYPNTYFIIISVVVSQCVLKYAYVCVCVCVKGHKKFWAFCSSILISICFGLRSVSSSSSSSSSSFPLPPLFLTFNHEPETRSRWIH